MTWRPSRSVYRRAAAIASVDSPAHTVRRTPKSKPDELQIARRSLQIIMAGKPILNQRTSPRRNRGECRMRLRPCPILCPFFWTNDGLPRPSSQDSATKKVEKTTPAKVAPPTPTDDLFFLTGASNYLSNRRSVITGFESADSIKCGSGRTRHASHHAVKSLPQASEIHFILREKLRKLRGKASKAAPKAAPLPAA